jgi:hypothetical protein
MRLLTSQQEWLKVMVDRLPGKILTEAGLAAFLPLVRYTRISGAKPRPFA